MMKKIVQFLALPAVCILVIACQRRDSPKPEPDAATLLYPEQNSACITGTVQSVSESFITFNWSAAANADGYELHLKNLISGDKSTLFTNSNKQVVTLLRNTPYAWYVVSKSTSSNQTATSAIWKFYNSGPAVVSHAPFPAEIIAPTFAQEVEAQNGKVALSWTGNDVDNDITTYDVYFGTALSPALLEGNLNKNSLSNVPVTSGTTYYWKVVSKDAKGNMSHSDWFQFRVR